MLWTRRELEKGAKMALKALDQLELVGAGGILDSALARQGTDPSMSMDHLARALAMVVKALGEQQLPPGARGPSRKIIPPLLISRIRTLLRAHKRPVTMAEDGLCGRVVRIVWPLVVGGDYSSGLEAPVELRHWFKAAKTRGE